MMMDYLRPLLRRVDPGLHDFQDEQVVLLHHPGVGDLAFEIGETLGDERWRDLLGRDGLEADRPELVAVAAGRIADLHHLRSELARRDRYDAFAGGSQRGKAVVGAA